MTTTTHRGSAILWIAFVVLAGLLALAYCRPFDMYLEDPSLPGLIGRATNNQSTESTGFPCEAMQVRTIDERIYSGSHSF